MKPDKAVDRLEEDFDPYCQCPTLLDVGVADAFLQWLENNIEYVEYLEQGRWKIAVLRRHIVARPDLKARLSTIGIEILDDDLRDNDEPLILEMLNAYFGGNGVYRKAAQLLAYGRKHTEDGDAVQIISRWESFRLIPNVQLYFIPDINYKASNEDGMFLRALDILQLHPQVKRTAYERFINRDYPTAIVETIKMLFAEVQDRVMPIDKTVAELDGYQLIHQAFDCSPEETKKDGTIKQERLPKIKINNLIKDSEWSEQKGFRDLGCGVASAIRNPISHSAVDLDFIRSRFGDRRTALKFLCLVSLLFEKLPKQDTQR